MKSKSINWGIVILALLLFGAVVTLYIIYILSPQLQQIKQLDLDIEDVKLQIQKKEEELQQLDLIRDEIAQCENEIAAANMKILPYNEVAKKISFFESSSKLNNLIIHKYNLRNGKRQSVSISGEYIEDVDKIKDDEPKGDLLYRELLVDLEVIGYYDSINTYLEQLKANIKPFTVYSVTLNADIEEDKADYVRAYYNLGRDSSVDGFVLATINLRTFSLYDEEQADDEIINHNYMEYEFDYDNPMRKIKSIEDVLRQLKGDTPTSSSRSNNDFFEHFKDLLKPPARPTTNPTISDKGVKNFKIAIKDAYESGANFYIVGPGDDGEYTTVQATTVQPAFFDLELSPNGYVYSLSSTDQPTKSFAKQMPLDECKVVIDSSVIEIRENQLLSTVINIKNDTGKLLRVEVRGSYKDRIFIYSTKSDTQINPGETVDNIMVSYI
ncbi:MAG: hypothetical protein GX327_04760 [Epulopiscium sp.]|jgi:hypothetical protein|nr:hypothetical protein [Candidatus Epulonipiscium sp.]